MAKKNVSFWLVSSFCNYNQELQMLPKKFKRTVLYGSRGSPTGFKISPSVILHELEHVVQFYGGDLTRRDGLLRVGEDGAMQKGRRNLEAICDFHIERRHRHRLARNDEASEVEEIRKRVGEEISACAPTNVQTPAAKTVRTRLRKFRRAADESLPKKR